ncbi:MAG: DNA-3-methyladenine glycosylase [Syntrophomonadaceae bacterium]|nr:DNA-3-methyladenine glycosylase [Syntrophomonadaceae bacterium]MDD3024492.1 DNA-3-methyladenine glycosylase [Syntrophomonadaceae bacterium]
MEIFKYGQAELDYLKKHDKKLGIAIEQIGFIEREVIPDLFSALVNSITAQQISAKAAATVWSRMQARLAEITPQAIATASVEEIQSCGLSLRKAGYIKGIGEAVVQGKLDLLALQEMSDRDIIEKLSALHGIGKWTVEMLLIFSLQRPDVVSWGDLAIQRGMMNLYGLKTLSKAQFDKYRKRYSPYGSVASLYLWALSKE